MKHILITGANRGIGLELAKQCYQEGWRVIACTRKVAEVENALLARNAGNQSAKGQLSIIELDVTSSHDREKLKEAIKNEPIDILFNNAGVWGPAESNFGTVAEEPWLEVLKVNTLAPLLLAQTLLQQIERSALKIIANMSSCMGSIADNKVGGGYIYRSSKAALNAVTKSMAIDLRHKGITVISLDPGWVKTDMGGINAPLAPDESARGLKKVLNTISLKDTGSFIDYAEKRVPW